MPKKPAQRPQWRYRTPKGPRPPGMKGETRKLSAAITTLGTAGAIALGSGVLDHHEQMQSAPAVSAVVVVDEPREHLAEQLRFLETIEPPVAGIAGSNTITLARSLTADPVIRRAMVTQLLTDGWAGPPTLVLEDET